MPPTFAGFFMLLEGVQLMGVGMTTVFAFLGLLVVAMHGSGAFFRANAHRFPDPPTPEPQPGAEIGNHSEIAVVLAAVAAHRGRGS